MRREGRQHGWYHVSRMPERRLDTYNDDGRLFAKYPSKPTNCSRYTSRCRTKGCRGCHDAPSSKARAKRKGRNKAFYRDIVKNYKLHDWVNHKLYDRKPMFSDEAPIDDEVSECSLDCYSYNVDDEVSGFNQEISEYDYGGDVCSLECTKAIDKLSEAEDDHVSEWSWESCELSDEGGFEEEWLVI